MQPSDFPDVRAEYEALPDDTKTKLIQWIRATIAPAKSIYGWSSYSMRLDAGDAIGVHIRNEEFKGAMLACGYSPTPGSAHEVNWRFRVKSNVPRGERPPAGMRGFGGLMRLKRRAAGIGLRELARRVDVSPAYLSQIENGKFQPPAEDKVIAIAEQLKVDPDVLLARAGRVPADILETIKQRPLEMAQLVRAAGRLMETKQDAQ